MLNARFSSRDSWQFLRPNGRTPAAGGVSLAAAHLHGGLTPSRSPYFSWIPMFAVMLIMTAPSPIVAQDAAPSVISETSNLYAALPAAEWSNLESAVDRGLA